MYRSCYCKNGASGGHHWRGPTPIATDIWWSSLETCSTCSLEALTPTLYWHLVVATKAGGTSYWNDVLFFVDFAARKWSCGKVMFYTCLFTGEGGRGVPYPRYQTPPPPEPQKRAVSIPLECLLVCYRPQIPPTRSCGKVMFSQACVKNSIHRGHVHPPGQAPPWQTPPSQQTASAADGTHPTGMHSCFFLFFF